jgi:type IV secretory pathway TraG/TraD family ATPase VirD4
LDWQHSMIYNDPKKELAKTLGPYREFLGNVFIFDPLSPNSHRFDPLRGRYTERQLTASAKQLLYRPHEGDAEVFTERAIKLLTILFMAGREENQQAGYEKYHLLPYVREMLELGLNKVAYRLHTVSPYLARLFLNGEYNPRTNYDDIKFLRDAYATLDARLWSILTKEVVSCFNGSDFTPEDFIYSKTPLTLFLCWSEAEMHSFAPLIRLVWDSLMNGMIHAYDNANGRPCYEVCCGMDEAGRTEIPALPHYASTVCGRKITIIPTFQSTAQIEATYGPARAKDIRNNCETKLVFKPGDYETAYELCKWLGSTTAYAHSETEHDGKTVSKGLSEREIPLMTPQEMELMDRREVFGICDGFPKFKAHRFNPRKCPEMVRRLKLYALPERSVYSQWLPARVPERSASMSYNRAEYD